MKTYTPGPWHTVNGFEGYVVETLKAFQERETICKINTTILEYEANANLIASAPEMLKMLETILPKLSQLQDESAFTLPEKVESLIAKAKGL